MVPHYCDKQGKTPYPQSHQVDEFLAANLTAPHICQSRIDNTLEPTRSHIDWMWFHIAQLEQPLGNCGEPSGTFKVISTGRNYLAHEFIFLAEEGVANSHNSRDTGERWCQGCENTVEDGRMLGFTLGVRTLAQNAAELSLEKLSTQSVNGPTVASFFVAVASSSDGASGE